MTTDLPISVKPSWARVPTYPFRPSFVPASSSYRQVMRVIGEADIFVVLPQHGDAVVESDVGRLAPLIFTHSICTPSICSRLKLDRISLGDQGPTTLVSLLLTPITRHSACPVPNPAQAGEPAPRPPILVHPDQFDPL
jgi:hypothetical protein